MHLYFGIKLTMFWLLSNFDMLFLCSLKTIKQMNKNPTNQATNNPKPTNCVRAPSRGKPSWKIFASIPVQRHVLETLPTVSITDNAVPLKKNNNKKNKLS